MTAPFLPPTPPPPAYNQTPVMQFAAPQYANDTEVRVSDTEVAIRFVTVDHFTAQAIEARRDANDPLAAAVSPVEAAKRPVALIMLSGEGADTLLNNLAEALGKKVADAKD